jgi:hypothetical protein
LKKLQKIVGLWMAILLTALSVIATAFITSEVSAAASSTQQEVYAVSSYKAVTYFIDSTQQEIIGENEQESLSLSVDDSPFLTTPNYNHSTLLSVPDHRQKITAENASFSKYYTKQILFPFHSYW